MEYPERTTVVEVDTAKGKLFGRVTSLHFSTNEFTIKTDAGDKIRLSTDSRWKVLTNG